MDEEGLSRKEKLALWRVKKGMGAGAKYSKVDKSAETGKGSQNHGGVLAARPDAVNVAKKPASRPAKRNTQRKPFQVDTRIVKEAGERRVAPGTPIHSLQKRLKRTKPAKKSASPKQHKPVPAGPSGAAEGVPASHLTARGQAKGKAAVAARVPGHVNGICRSLDAARTKEVSDYLKSQISEANMLLEIAGVDAARTLLSDLLSCTAAGKGVGELALYWAARAKLEEESGNYSVARSILDEGQAYISMPTQQKVMTKVFAAFEGRMNDRAEVEVAQLLEDSIETLNSSAANSNSPASSALFRYDPNELSMEDDSGGAASAIKNLNFSKVCSEDGGYRRSSQEERLSSGVVGMSNGVVFESLSGIVLSDEDSDRSVSDIDESVIARAEAFNLQEEERKARKAEEERFSDEEDFYRAGSYPEETRRTVTTSSYQGDAEAEPSRIDSEELVVDSCAFDSTSSFKSVPQPPKAQKGRASSTMAPPQAREPKKRKGTPHPKPKKKVTSSDAEIGANELSPGSFIAQVESKGKDGKRTLTPVRRSRRISGVPKPEEETPSLLRKEMEALLG